MSYFGVVNERLTYWLTYSLEQGISLETNRLFSQSRNSPHFTEPELSLPHSQMPVTCPYPEPARSSPYIPATHFLKIHLNIILPSMPGSPKWSHALRFPHQNPVYVSLPPTRATWPAHLILLDWSPNQYWVRSTDHSAPHFAASSTSMLHST